MDDEHTLRIGIDDFKKHMFMDESSLWNPPVITDQVQESLEAAMRSDGTEVSAPDRFGAKAQIDFAEDGTMYVYFFASGIVRRYKPEAS